MGGWQMISSPPSSHPFQLSILSEEQIRSAQLRIQESSGIVLSPQVLQPMFRPMQSSSEGEGETPCGSDQGLEQLTDVSGSDQVQSPDKLVSPGCSIVVHSLAPHPRCTPPHTIFTAFHFIPLPSHSPPLLLQEKRIAMAANEVCSLLRILDNQTYACRSVEALQKLRRTLVGGVGYQLSSSYRGH